jgi:hypothetical protein
MPGPGYPAALNRAQARPRSGVVDSSVIARAHPTDGDLEGWRRAQAVQNPRVRYG